MLSHDERQTISRALIRWVLGPVVFLVIGYAIPTFAIDDGLERWAEKPAEYRTAVNALEITQQGCEFTNFKLLIPRIRVSNVQQVRGSCRDAAAEPDLADYVACVRMHTLFGIPTGTLRATCGGNVIRCSNAPP